MDNPHGIGCQCPTCKSEEPQRVVTIRMPKSLHEKLKNKAHDDRTSMNQFCISKLQDAVLDGASNPAPDQSASGPQVNSTT